MPGVKYMGEKMKKFKDFIYDKNDIIIAVLILAVAALIIFWRLSVILEYPKQLLGNDEPNVENPVDNTGGNSADTDEPADNIDSGDNSGSGSDSGGSGSDSGGGSGSDESGGSDSGGGSGSDTGGEDYYE